LHESVERFNSCWIGIPAAGCSVSLEEPVLAEVPVFLPPPVFPLPPPIPANPTKNAGRASIANQLRPRLGSANNSNGKK
jgi:hypothetical protein